MIDMDVNMHIHSCVCVSIHIQIEISICLYLYLSLYRCMYRGDARQSVSYTRSDAQARAYFGSGVSVTRAAARSDGTWCDGRRGISH